MAEMLIEGERKEQEEGQERKEEEKETFGKRTRPTIKGVAHCV